MNVRPSLFSLLVYVGFVLFTSAAIAETTITVEVHSDQPGATIHRNIYGQFMEHLGRGIYEGVWVGEDSKIPNKNGYRKDVVKALKALEVPLLRWPGGCFADEYHWRDGVGPRDQRPVTINTTWGGVSDDNAFGTHEFFELAEMLDAEVYINGNLGTGTPREMAAWLEYMTAEGESTLANLRRANGRDKPWKVDYFAIGNEAWGCGGTMTPDYYANLYKHYATFAKTPENNRPIMIASGGHTEQTEWTQTLLEQVPNTWSLRMNAISHHYYTLPTGDWDKHGRALAFGENEWFSTLKNTLRIEEFIKANIAIMDKLDPEKKVGFYVDEWGTWYDVEPGDNPGFLYQQNTIRDAVLTGMNLNIFHQYAERVQMTNIAQMVNVLQAMILTDKEKMLLTPTYHVFKMYIPFQDATAYPVSISGDKGYRFGEESIPGISASAAKSKDGKLWLALVNTHPSEAKSVSIATAGKLRTAKGQLLTSAAMDAHNTFDSPESVQPKEYKAKAKDGSLILDLPAKSVVVVELK
ncbi:alpha-N-arabinofuranosidase [Teredinibacter haidensis]|uniref:alpha-N-arabinofuranosidase n=1 Tax=Teredinibacter haidensis TaxID=2731755 RepID=UPI0009488E6B|nr:alpha-L-arabinofuranosidase C-terminal domain-containing protein [Teredinibacter haidensis]